MIACEYVGELLQIGVLVIDAIRLPGNYLSANLNLLKHYARCITQTI